jgi:hypothetical protein
VIKTLLITGSIAMVVGLSGTLLDLFGGGTLAMEYLGFAVLVVLFVAILIGSYWFVMIKPPENR